ncbi:response regulator transcription factor [Streptomyces roseirectus]|uniref:Response regulator transcription factor n=1 Tax=Streptomyces roseirectus TaxID=2768066 RepID=A0A7H0IEJ0_9ACTN|nr:LuxR C-terminal-related transcriptional regulator [Streptomyces roseirectus]QNP71206.1 response regulator transcription factor [Streptomyces roseirectus]
MFSHHQLAAATRIGMLTRERDQALARDQALGELARTLPFDAATLLALDPLTGTHVQVAGVGYTARESHSLAAEFVTTPWYRNVVRGELPPSICEDAEEAGTLGGRFRHGRFYAERVRPAGFRDGVTGALRHRGRLVGMIHLNTESADAYGTPNRLLLAAVMPALAALTDPLAGDVHDLPEHGAASLVTAGGVISLPGRAPARTLDDPELAALVRDFAGTGGRRLRLLWADGGTWYRVTLHRRPAPDGVLVHEMPTEPPFGLSPREVEVLTRAATGQTNRAIAQALFLSPRTVHTHVEHVLRKTGAASRAEATALAVRDGLLRPGPEDLGFFVER